MRWAILLGLATFGGPAAAQDRQPLSVSMTECHVILAIVADLASARRTEDEIAKLRRSSDAFGLAAFDAARAEGRADPQAHVLAVRDVVAPEWERKVGGIFTLSETLDRIDYCGALGRDRGILE